MSNLVVVTFDSAAEANEVRQKLKELEKEGQISLEDTSVIVKGDDGKVHIIDEVGNTVKAGAVMGGILGLFLLFAFPVAGIVAGAAGGALVGRSLDRGVDKKFVKELSESLEPGHSALFVAVNHANANAIIAALKPYRGKVYQTTLSEEAEQELREILEHTTAAQNPNANG
jgi:uncharacterized membrane protein